MLKQVPKPKNLDEEYIGNSTTVKGHRFRGRYDKDGRYYEHDQCCDRWYLLVDPESPAE